MREEEREVKRVRSTRLPSVGMGDGRYHLETDKVDRFELVDKRQSTSHGQIPASEMISTAQDWILIGVKLHLYSLCKQMKTITCKLEATIS